MQEVPGGNLINVMSYLNEKYNKEVVPAMMKKFSYKSKMAVPKIEKVMINCGYGRLIAGKTKDESKKIQEAIARDITLIAGQKAVLTKSRQSISSFKIREGQEIGCKTTLRRKKMVDFLERLINVTLPRSRDFQGLSADGMDKFGNYSFGIKEHIAFPEILPEKANFIFGFQVTIVTSAENEEEGLELLKLIGVPIRS
jgi:large subunit ribosomal protein L5